MLNFKCMNYRLLAVLGLILFQTPLAQAAAPLESQLVEALKGAEASLGTLDPWQKSIFTEEMLADSERFFRDIKSGEEPKPDLGLAKDFIKFHASKFYSGKSGESAAPAAVYVWFKSAKACDYCSEAMGPMKLELTRRLERRGFSPVWVTTPELTEWAKTNELTPSQFGSPAHLSEMAQSRKAAGSVWIELRPLQGEEIDSAHSDEQHFRVALETHFFRPQNLPAAARTILQSSSAVEIREKESAGIVMKRLFMDAMGDVGAQTDGAIAQIRRLGGKADGDSEERLVEVRGLGEFGTLLSVTEGLERITGDPVMLRKLSRGKAEFLILSDKPKVELQKRIGTWSQDRTLAGTEADLKSAEGEESQ